MKKSKWLCSAALAATLAIPSAAVAETVVVYGADGEPGADGVGGPGGEGQSGGDASATAGNPTDSPNLAKANGGNGGVGGAANITAGTAARAGQRLRGRRPQLRTLPETAPRARSRTGV